MDLYEALMQSNETMDEEETEIDDDNVASCSGKPKGNKLIREVCKGGHSLFKCPYCQFTGGMRLVKGHIRLHHSERLRCGYCSGHFVTSRQFRRHICPNVGLEKARKYVKRRLPTHAMVPSGDIQEAVKGTNALSDAVAGQLMLKSGDLKPSEKQHLRNRLKYAAQWAKKHEDDHLHTRCLYCMRRMLICDGIQPPTAASIVEGWLTSLSNGDENRRQLLESRFTSSQFNVLCNKHFDVTDFISYKLGTRLPVPELEPAPELEMKPVRTEKLPETNAPEPVYEGYPED